MKLAAVVAWALLSGAPLYAQGAGNPSGPSGHWEGSIAAPGLELEFAVDLAKNSKGELVGTISIPSQNLNGVPLTSVSADGPAVRFVLRSSTGGGPFEGGLSADGTTLSGDFITRGFAVPFSLTRTGDARIEPAPRSPSIGKEFEGRWDGTLDLGGRLLPLVLVMTNLPDGTSTGTLTGDGLEVPITIKQDGRQLTVAGKSVGSSYAGVLNASGTELAGTYSQASLVLPLVFRRASAAGGK